MDTLGEGFVISGVVLGVYFRTLYKSIPGGDAGELVAESCTLGHVRSTFMQNLSIFLTKH